MSRLRAMDPRRIDLWIGLFFLIEFQIELSLVDVSGSDEWAARGLVALSASGLAVRTRAPLFATAACFGCLAGMALLTPRLEELVMPFFVVFGIAFSLGVLCEGRRLAAGLAMALGAVALAIAIDPEEVGPGEFVFVAVILVAGPVLAGRVLRSRMRLAEVLREKAERAERERSDTVARAVSAERGRIAGELHDVVSHALSAMVVQASAARTLARRDPARAREAFGAIEQEGRDALDEMRRLLGVLRRADEDLALAPQPSLEHLSTLIRRASAAGLPVELELAGERRRIPLGTDLIAYRVLQEALRGAVEAGGAGHARVRVAYAPDHVEVSVHDDGGGRRNLLGVEQRVALYGGRLVAGPGRGGGHTVRARLPLEVAA